MAAGTTQPKSACKENQRPGSDIIPAEVLHALDEDDRKRLRHTLVNWYRAKLFLEEASQAEVVSLFKKGLSHSIRELQDDLVS